MNHPSLPLDPELTRTTLAAVTALRDLRLMTARYVARQDDRAAWQVAMTAWGMAAKALIEAGGRDVLADLIATPRFVAEPTDPREQQGTISEDLQLAQAFAASSSGPAADHGEPTQIHAGSVGYPITRAEHPFKHDTEGSMGKDTGQRVTRREVIEAELQAIGDAISALEAQRFALADDLGAIDIEACGLAGPLDDDGPTLQELAMVPIAERVAPPRPLAGDEHSRREAEREAHWDAARKERER